MHPGMAELYRQKVPTLAQASSTHNTRTEVARALRGFIDAIVVTKPGRAAKLNGNLAAMLSATQHAKISPEGYLLL